MKSLYSPAIAALLAVLLPQIAARADDAAKPFEFIQYVEEGDWFTWRDERMRIRIPGDWSVKLVRDEPIPPEKQAEWFLDGEPQKPADHKWTYVLKDNRDRDVFEILVVQHGPEWIGCLCAPYDEYEYLERHPYEIWGLTLAMDLPWGAANRPHQPQTTRTVKVARQELRLDIHADLWVHGHEANKLRYIAENARVLR